MKVYEVSLVDEDGVPHGHGIIPIQATNFANAVEDYLLLYRVYLQEGLCLVVKIPDSDVAIKVDLGIINY